MVLERQGMQHRWGWACAMAAHCAGGMEDGHVERVDGAPGEKKERRRVEGGARE